MRSYDYSNLTILKGYKTPFRRQGHILTSISFIDLYVKTIILTSCIIEVVTLVTTEIMVTLVTAETVVTVDTLVTAETVVTVVTAETVVTLGTAETMVTLVTTRTLMTVH